MAARKPSIETIECNSASGSKLLGISQQYFNAAVRDGWIKPKARNLYRVIDAVHGYIAFLKDEGRRTSKSAEASRVQAARAAQIELQTERELGKLIEIEEVQAFLSETMGTLRSELAGLAAASTRDLQLRAEIEKNLNASLDRCRKAFEAAIAAIRNGKQLPLDGEETDT